MVYIGLAELYEHPCQHPLKKCSSIHLNFLWYCSDRNIGVARAISVGGSTTMGGNPLLDLQEVATQPCLWVIMQARVGVG